MNRYERKLKGKQVQQKRFIPRCFNSYAEYISVQKESEEADERLSGRIKCFNDKYRKNGCLPYYLRYWNRCSDWYRGGRIMAALKEHDKKSRRNFNRHAVDQLKRDYEAEFVDRSKFGDLRDFT